MGARGRKSAAALTLRRPARVLVVERPSPPVSLSDEAAAEWREVVGSLPADHFGRAVQPLLEAYCSNVIAMRDIDQRIQALTGNESDALGRYDRLLTMRGREAGRMAVLAVRLGFACASRLSSAKPVQGNPEKLWERPDQG